MLSPLAVFFRLFNSTCWAAALLLVGRRISGVWIAETAVDLLHALKRASAFWAWDRPPPPPPVADRAPSGVRVEQRCSSLSRCFRQ